MPKRQGCAWRIIGFARIIMLQNLAVYFIAFGLISLSLGQFFVSGLSLRRMLRRHKAIRKTQLDRLRSATQVARLNSQLSASSDASRQWRAMEVLRVVEESNDAKSFYLADPNQQSLPLFHPGQFLMIRPALAGKYQATRCYSLSVAPNTKLWRITVKKQATDQPLRADRKTGGLSSWMHENIQDGDCLLVGGPSGHFYLAPEIQAPIVLLAAGVGITPMASMLQYSSHFTPRRPVTLYYQAKDQYHWPLGAEVHGYSKLVDTCKVISYLSRTSDADLKQLAQEHAGTFRKGKFSALDIASESNNPQAHYYMCGPEDWMAAIREQLTASGVPSDQIHWESFGSATAQIPTDGSTCEQSFNVQFARSGVASATTSSDQSLWELAQANDVPIPSGCLSGVCGSCKVKLLQGAIKYDRTISASLADNECLTCVARPTSDVVLEA